MTVVRCPVAGTYLVRDEAEPIPLGKTAADVSVVVHRYEFGWVCERCGFRDDTPLQDCKHVEAAKEEARS